MGEKEGKDKEKQKKTEGGDGGPNTVVLKMDLHCEGCALKIKRSVKRFDGVEAVSVDVAGNKLTVVGKVDPVLLRERVEEKTRKKVELVSSVDSAAKPKDSGGDTKKPTASAAAGSSAATEMKQPAKEKKAKEPRASIVVLKIRLHCEGCINRIRKTIYKIKGVEDVAVDAGKDLVTIKSTVDPKILPSILKDKLKRGIKSTVDPKILPSILKDKLKRGIEVIASKKDDGSGDKEDENNNEKKSDGGEKKRDAEVKKDGGGEKKNVDDSSKNNVKKEADKTSSTITMNKMDGYLVEIAPLPFEYRVEMGSTSYGYENRLAQEPYQYRVNMAQAPLGYGVDWTHAPQMFSDEDPNACFIM